MKIRRWIWLALAVLIGILLLWAFQGLRNQDNPIATGVFDGTRALEDISAQVAFGPRVPGSEAQTAFIDWAKDQLQAAGWQVEIQSTTYDGKPVQNLIASKGTGDNWIVLGAHYDSRLHADRDPDPANRATPVPGANDGASGVAVLLELARVLPVADHQEIWLVLFDVEDNGRIEGWDWILGSRAFVASLTTLPDAAVIVDMIGDADLTIYMEKNSDPAISQQIWQIAAELGYTQFIPQTNYRILDDHIPFLERGIPAVDIIDIDYAYYHTTQDTPDKVAAESLQAVGDTLLTWLTGKP